MFDYSKSNPNWEKETIQKVLLEHVNEQKRARRWSIFFKLVIIGMIASVFFMGDSKRKTPTASSRPHVATIEIYGEIDAFGENNSENIRKALRSAFYNRYVQGVVLKINSGGGSAVQARQVYREVQYLKENYPGIPVYAVIEDVGASAAYLIACAADEIYADQTSIVGSIGAKIDSFGFVDAMQKVGVERRIYSDSPYKRILDPFSPMNEEESSFVVKQVKAAHDAFIDNVRKGRKERLKESPELFSGLFWAGTNAINLGLIDGFYDTEELVRNKFQTRNTIDYTVTPNVWEKLARKMGASFKNSLGMNSQQGIQ